jgi:lysophospholipase L1-like esterase
VAEAGRRGRRSMRTRALAIGSALAVLVVAGCAGSYPGASSEPASVAEAPRSARPAAPLERVLVLGDSAMADASPPFEAAFLASGTARFESGAAGGFGLTGLDSNRSSSPWREDWRRRVDAFRPDLSILMLGGWDIWWVEEHGLGAYRDLMLEAVDVLSSRGGKVLWLQMLPSGPPEDRHPIDHVGATLAGARPGTLYTLDVEPSLAGPGGDLPQSFVDESGRTVKLRKLDGWHLCQDGAARLVEHVLDELHDLGLSPMPEPGWQGDRWRDDEVFEDPACWPRDLDDSVAPSPRARSGRDEPPPDGGRRSGVGAVDDRPAVGTTTVR